MIYLLLLRRGYWIVLRMLNFLTIATLFGSVIAAMLLLDRFTGNIAFIQKTYLLSYPYFFHFFKKMIINITQNKTSFKTRNLLLVLINVLLLRVLLLRNKYTRTRNVTR